MRAPKARTVYGERMKRVLSEPMGPYSHAIKVDDLRCSIVFVAGQLALDAKGNIVSERDIVGQYECILRQIDAILSDSGGDIQNVTKLVHYVVLNVSSGIFLTKLYPQISAIRRKFFKKVFPVSTMVGVSSLMHKKALIEVDAVAVIPK